MSHHHRFMARALRLAERGLYSTDPNPRVGCVLVRDGRIVGEGWHAFAGGAHAEVEALRAAGDQARGATAYVTLEPCSHHGRTPPCCAALITAGVGAVVAAMEDPNPRVAGRGLAALRAAGVEVETGVMAAEAAALNPGFVLRMTRRRPFVRCKVAAAADGRTAMAGGESRWITGEAARRDVQRLRARSSAVLTGIGTVLADDPELTVRAPEAAGPRGLRQPLRVVADSRLRLPREARMLEQPQGLLVAAARDDGPARAKLQDVGARVEMLPGAGGRVDLAALLRRLAQLEINEVLVEAGPVLNGALLRDKLIDEFVFYIAPRLLGDAARGMFQVPGLERLADSVPLAFTGMRRVGGDIRITARPLHGQGAS